MGDEEFFEWDVPFAQSETAVSDLELEETIADILTPDDDDVFEETSASTFESDLRSGLGALPHGRVADARRPPSGGAAPRGHLGGVVLHGRFELARGGDGATVVGPRGFARSHQ